MDKNIFQILNAREEFLVHLNSDIEKNNQIIHDTIEESKRLETTIKTIESLKIYPEHEAFIPMSKNIFLKGKILHTGEYYIKKTADPNSYLILQTANQTLQSLKEQVKVKETEIEKANYAKYQLEERKAVLMGEKFRDDFDENDAESGHIYDDDDESVSSEEKTAQLNNIFSDKGVAIRVGDYYEIFEYED